MLADYRDFGYLFQIVQIIILFLCLQLLSVYRCLKIKTNYFYNVILILITLNVHSVNLKQVQIHLICISKIYICSSASNFIHIFLKRKIFFSFTLNLFDDTMYQITPTWLLNFKNIFHSILTCK